MIAQDALSHRLTRQEEAKLVRAYRAGYRKMPENRREVAAANAAAVELLGTVEW